MITSPLGLHVPSSNEPGAVIGQSDIEKCINEQASALPTPQSLLVWPSASQSFHAASLVTDRLSACSQSRSASEIRCSAAPMSWPDCASHSKCPLSEENLHQNLNVHEKQHAILVENEAFNAMHDAYSTPRDLCASSLDGWRKLDEEHIASSMPANTALKANRFKERIRQEAYRMDLEANRMDWQPACSEFPAASGQGIDNILHSCADAAVELKSHSFSQASSRATTPMRRCEASGSDGPAGAAALAATYNRSPASPAAAKDPVSCRTQSAWYDASDDEEDEHDKIAAELQRLRAEAKRRETMAMQLRCTSNRCILNGLQMSASVIQRTLNGNLCN